MDFRKVLKSFFLLTVSFELMGIDLMSPDIDCTIVKVYSKFHLPEIEVFPRKFQNISHNSLHDTGLIIARKVIHRAKVIRAKKAKGYEEIHLRIGVQLLRLELQGKEMSRQGKLFFQKQALAKVTCH